MNEKVSKRLCVKNHQEYNKALSAIRSSKVLINNGIKNKDLEYLSEGLFNLDFLLEDLKLYKN